ncbi:hypothetical protein P4S72_09595 [Vibrio sp. PP-XX7]
MALLAYHITINNNKGAPNCATEDSIKCISSAFNAEEEKAEKSNAECAIATSKHNSKLSILFLDEKLSVNKHVKHARSQSHSWIVALSPCHKQAVMYSDWLSSRSSKIVESVLNLRNKNFQKIKKIQSPSVALLSTLK